MRHPSKVGTFCQRKGDKFLGIGGPPHPTRLRRRGPKRPAQRGMPHAEQGKDFGWRLNARRTRDAFRKAQRIARSLQESK